jgi:hypothetical protein
MEINAHTWFFNRSLKGFRPCYNAMCAINLLYFIHRLSNILYLNPQRFGRFFCFRLHGTEPYSAGPHGTASATLVQLQKLFSV